MNISYRWRRSNGNCYSVKSAFVVPTYMLQQYIGSQSHEQEIADGKEQIAEAWDTLRARKSELEEQEAQLDEMEAAMQAMMSSGQYGSMTQPGESGMQIPAGAEQLAGGGAQTGMEQFAGDRTPRWRRRVGTGEGGFRRRKSRV